MSDVASAIETLIDYRLDCKLEDAVDTAVENTIESKIDDKISDVEAAIEDLKSDLEGEDDDIKSRLDELEGKDSLDISAIMTRLDGLELKLASLDPRIEAAMISYNSNASIKNELSQLLARVINLLQDIT